jgi:hypothetical protein
MIQKTISLVVLTLNFSITTEVFLNSEHHRAHTGTQACLADDGEPNENLPGALDPTAGVQGVHPYAYRSPQATTHICYHQKKS